MLNIEKIAAGLRRCKAAPDFFITDDINMPENVLEIPIYIIRSINFTPYGDSDLKLIPVWKNEIYRNYTYDFERGYEEF